MGRGCLNARSAGILPAGARASRSREWRGQDAHAPAGETPALPKARATQGRRGVAHTSFGMCATLPEVPLNLVDQPDAVCPMPEGRTMTLGTHTLEDDVCAAREYTGYYRLPHPSLAPATCGLCRRLVGDFEMRTSWSTFDKAGENSATGAWEAPKTPIPVFSPGTLAISQAKGQIQNSRFKIQEIKTTERGQIQNSRFKNSSVQL